MTLRPLQERVLNLSGQSRAEILGACLAPKSNFDPALHHLDMMVAQDITMTDPLPSMGTKMCWPHNDGDMT